MEQKLTIEISNEEIIVERILQKLNQKLDAKIEDAFTEGPLNQAQIAKFLTIGKETVQKYEKMGMPFGHIGARKFYDRQKCLEWQTNAKIDELI